jgi:hypothetical protein
MAVRVSRNTKCTLMRIVAFSFAHGVLLVVWVMIWIGAHPDPYAPHNALEAFAQAAIRCLGGFYLAIKWLAGGPGSLGQWDFVCGIANSIVYGASAELVWRLFRRGRTPEPGPMTCGQCGYSLTGNLSGRCPECGTTIPSASERNGAT